MSLKNQNVFCIRINYSISRFPTFHLLSKSVVRLSSVTSHKSSLFSVVVKIFPMNHWWAVKQVCEAEISSTCGITRQFLPITHLGIMVVKLTVTLALCINLASGLILCGLLPCPNRRTTGEDPLTVYGSWIESRSLNNGQIYLFANDAGTKDWFEAEQYCIDRGGFLAEPVNENESNFIRDQANRQPDANWWLGKKNFVNVIVP